MTVSDHLVMKSDYFREHYRVLLDSPEWKSFRKAFIARRGGVCERCGRKGPVLQVHHLCYRDSVRPWDYSDSELQCLCLDCHEAVHAELLSSGKRVPYYDSPGHVSSVPEQSRCLRCGGSGLREEYPYLLGGICFRCFGTGIRYAHPYSMEEATRYGQRIYNQWRLRHESPEGEIDSTRFTCAEDVRDWLRSFNDDD